MSNCKIDVKTLGSKCKTNDDCCGHGTCLDCDADKDNDKCKGKSGKICVCEDGWFGNHCNTRYSLGCGDDSDCGDHGTCDDNGYCACKDDYTGFHCKAAKGFDCGEDVDCGDHGTCSPYGACICDPKEKWSGKHCLLAPSDKRCTSDKDCGNFGMYGSCNTDSNSCVCTNSGGGVSNMCSQKCDPDDPDACLHGGICDPTYFICKCRGGWSGWKCQNPPSDGSCASDSDCGDLVTHGICQGGHCICDKYFKGPNCTQMDIPNPNDPNQIAAWAEFAALMVAGEYGLLYMLVQALINNPEAALRLIIMIAPPMGLAGLKKVLAKWGQAVKDPELYKNAATNFIAEGEETANLERDLADEMTESLMRESAEEGAKVVAESSLKEVLSLALEAVAWAFDMVMIAGMILDMADPAGLNLEMHDDMIDIIRMKYLAGINQSPYMVSKGLSLPAEAQAEHSLKFMKMMRDDAVKKKISTYSKAYIDNLEMNSLGSIIIKLPPGVTQDDYMADPEKFAPSGFLWRLSFNNEGLYNFYKSHSVAIITTLSLLIACLALYFIVLK